MPATSRRLIIRPDATIAAGAGAILAGGASSHHGAQDDPVIAPAAVDGQSTAFSGGNRFVTLGMQEPAVPVGEYVRSITAVVNSSVPPNLTLFAGAVQIALGTPGVALGNDWASIAWIFAQGAFAPVDLRVREEGEEAAVIRALYLTLELAYRNPSRSVV